VTDVRFELFDGTHSSIEYRYPTALRYLAERLSPQPFLKERNRAKIEGVRHRRETGARGRTNRGGPALGRAAGGVHPRRPPARARPRRALPDRVRGAALFADISGFTALTEALADELGPQLGAEELTTHLNRVFHEVIAALDRFGGEVIYFSGDAVTCWIDADDGSRAAAAALAIQKVMHDVREVTTPAARPSSWR